MIIAVMVVTGFRNEITKKVIGFGAHIRIGNFDSNNSYEEQPLSLNAPFFKKLDSWPGVSHVQKFATKAGIIKTENEIEGIVLKGVGSDYSWEFLQDKIIEGRIIQTGDSLPMQEVLLSLTTAGRLSLKTGDTMIVYFIEQPARVRKFRVAGIYETGLNEFDNIYVFCDIGVIRKLNGWNTEQAGGIELLVSDFSNLDRLNKELNDAAGYRYYTQSIREQYPQMFHWLDLQNINVVIIITLILLIAGISMIATLLIIILENSALVGILKAMGATDKSVRKIFIYIAMPVIGTGIVAGNIIGIFLALLQLQFGFVTLPQESYYVAVVPVNFSFLHLVLINAGTILACLLMLIGPSMVITRISPARVIRYE